MPERIRVHRHLIGPMARDLRGDFAVAMVVALGARVLTLWPRAQRFEERGSDVVCDENMQLS